MNTTGQGLKPSYSIQEIEGAINYWRTQEGISADAQGAKLGVHARALADVYGLMIYQKASTIEAGQLTAPQMEALKLIK